MGLIPSIIIIGLIVYIIWVKSKKSSNKDNHIQKKAEIKFCSECGAKLDENSRFCSECGTENT